MKPYTRSIFDLFDGKRRYVIPLFQRQYVWNREKQWELLWEDISRVSELRQGGNSLPPHFLGALVLNQIRTYGNQVPAHLIIDGQQRLMTFQIVLAALRDVAKDAEASDFADEVQRYLENTGIMADPAEECFKVWPSKFDQKAFRSIILPDRMLEGEASKNEDSLILRAFEYFYEAMKDFVKQGQPKLRVETLYQALRHDLEVVSIELDEDDDPQMIFETLNARGEPLLPSDLLRNNLFWRARDKNEDKDVLYEKYWVRFDQKFWKQEERIGRLKKPRIDLFMQDFIQCQEGNEINIGRLYYEYKLWIKERNPFSTVESELRALNDCADRFQQIIQAKPGESSYGEFFWRLNQIDVGTIYPLLLHILSHPKSEEDEISGIFVDLESYLFRRLICGLTPKNYNRIFLQLIRDLIKDGFSRRTLQAKLLQMGGEASRWPDDLEFTEAWLRHSVYLDVKPAQRMVVILKAIEETLGQAKSEKMQIVSPLSIEHIMPQSWHKTWPLSDGTYTKDRLSRTLEGIRNTEADERDSIVHTIGNLTLLTQPLNSAISNGMWDKKRPEICGQSRLALNSYFQERPEWNVQEIEERGKMLLDRALKIWPFPKK